MIKLIILLVLSQGTLQSPRRQQARHYDQDWMKYMIGEVFFKENSNQGNQHISLEDEDNEDDDTEEIPYSVLEQYDTYEKRHYPAATFACNNVTNIDTAADPLAGLDDMNPFEIMGSKRYKNRHESQMFMELFRYIAGVNQEQEKIEMTRPVVVFHNVTKETPLGNYEDLCMCFYLPAKYQADHAHSDERSSRHAAEVPPQPLDNSAVYLYTAPAHHVFVRRFGGYALTHNQWEKEMEALEADLVYDRHSYQQGQYYTAGYNSPWKLHNRRNEVWMQCLESLEDKKKF
jgi:hypothetical protein